MQKPGIIIAVLLLISVINYQHIKGHENVRPVLVVSLLSIGALLALLIVEVVKFLKEKKGLS